MSEYINIDGKSAHYDRIDVRDAVRARARLRAFDEWVDTWGRGMDFTERAEKFHGFKAGWIAGIKYFEDMVMKKWYCVQCGSLTKVEMAYDIETDTETEPCECHPRS